MVAPDTARERRDSHVPGCRTQSRTARLRVHFESSAAPMPSPRRRGRVPLLPSRHPGPWCGQPPPVKSCRVKRTRSCLTGTDGRPSLGAMHERMSILSPTGHLGFTPIERGSFELGVAQRPDAIVADSGSCDIGPQPLGADEHCSPEEWQRHDLELMLLAARRLGVPMIVGSASDTGTDRGVNQYAGVIRELGRRHRLAPFKLATICSQVSREEVARRLEEGVRIEGLDGRPPLSEETLARTDRIVAVMGVAPIIRALDEGAEVV